MHRCINLTTINNRLHRQWHRHRLQLLEVEPTACMDGYIGSGVGDLGGGSRVHPRQRLAIQWAGASLGYMPGVP